MAMTMSQAPAAAHQERVQIPLRLPHAAQAKASLKKVQRQAAWVTEGAAIGVAISLARLTRKEAAARIDMAENQLAAQIAGAEAPQVWRFEQDPMLSGPVAVAKALQRPEVFDVRWTITAKVAR